MSERASEIAEAILMVIRRILKWLGIAFGGVLALGVVAAAGAWAWSYFTYQLPKSKVEVATGLGDERCNDYYPVFITVVNKSDRTILKTFVRLEAFLPGRSSNLADWGSISDDRVIKSGEGFGSCHRPALSSSAAQDTDLKTLEWRVASFDVVFEEK